MPFSMHEAGFHKGALDAEEKQALHLPSPPPPVFRGPDEDRLMTRKRKALFLRQSLLIADYFSRNLVTHSMLMRALPWLEREQYDAIAIERNSYGRCGYVLCSNPLGTSISQTYRVDVRNRRVYDATERKPFCSDWCFSAARHIRKQISREPGWCRTETNCTKLTLLPKSAPTHPGTLVLDAFRRLRLSGDDSLSEEDDECLSRSPASRSSDSDGDSLCGHHVEGEYKGPDARHPSWKQPSTETSWGVHIEPPKNLVVVQQHSPVSSSATERPVFFHTKEPLPEPVNYDLFGRVRSRFFQWLSPSAFVALTNIEVLTVTGTGEDKISEHSWSPSAGSTVLPLVDCVSVKTIRCQLLMDELLPSVKAIISRLNAPSQSVIEHLDAVIPFLKLTNRNIHMSSAERTVAALTFLRLMAKQHQILLPLLEAPQLRAVLENVCDRSGDEFVEDIINPLCVRFGCT